MSGLTDLPDELLYAIFGHLNFVDRINARTVDKKMAAFQSRNYEHIFDKARAILNTQYIKKAISYQRRIVQICIYYQIKPKYTSVNKIVSKNNTNSIIGRELSGKYMAMFEGLYIYVQMRYEKGDYSAFPPDTKYLQLVELLAEIAYTRADFVPHSIGYLRGRPYPLYTVTSRDIFNELLKLLFMIHKSFDSNLYYDTAIKHGVYLSIHEFCKLRDSRIVAAITNDRVIHYFIALYLYSSTGISYINLPGFNKVDSIKYYRPSSIVNIKKSANEFFEQMIDCYTNEDVYMSKKDIQILRKGIYSLFVEQAKKDDDAVCAMVITDSSRIKSIDGVMRFI